VAPAPQEAPINRTLTLNGPYSVCLQLSNCMLLLHVVIAAADTALSGHRQIGWLPRARTCNTRLSIQRCGSNTMRRTCMQARQHSGAAAERRW
jgi:hypothetical protein